MTFSDLLAIAFGNLLRMKLRTFLTVTGVVIAIAAFVALLSFGAGNQKYVTEQFEELGLFTTTIVYPPDSTSAGAGTDSARVVILDDKAVADLAALPGVDLAYPFDAFDVTAVLGDSQQVTRAQALPAAAAGTKLFAKLRAGTVFSGDSAHEAVVTDQFVRRMGMDTVDSAIGRSIIISTRRSSIDSGLAGVFRDQGGEIRKRLTHIRFDSLAYPAYRRDVVRGELKAAMDRFMNGFMDRQVEIRDTLIIRGVIEGLRGNRIRTESIIIPVATARRFTTGGISANPTELFAAVQRGGLFRDPDSTTREYPQVTLVLDPRAAAKPIGDSIKAMGYRTFSFAEEFDQIRKFFLYFDLVLGIIGGIALVTASLGIINTMIMSIVERTREIGVLKALGADDRDIRLLFLVESGVIGAVGSILGILLGWLMTRAASLISQSIMKSTGVDPIEMFDVPFWLIAIAFLFGLSVSIIAGAFPARRASRIDPVVALRNE